MADVFISYKREDEPAARRIVTALRAAGLSVWWDKDIPPNAPWRATIEERLDHARLCLVLWSRLSAGKEGGYVKEEAERARARGIYLGVSIDDAAPAFGFGELQAVPMTVQRGAASRRQIYTLIEVVHARLGEGASIAAPPPAPRRRISWVPLAAGGAALLCGGAAWLLDPLDWRERKPAAPPAEAATASAIDGIARFTGVVSNAMQIDENEKLFTFLKAHDGRPVHLGLIVEHTHDAPETAASMDSRCNRSTAPDPGVWRAHHSAGAVHDKLVILPVIAAKADPAAFDYRHESALFATRLDCRSGIRLIPLQDHPSPVTGSDADGAPEITVKGHFLNERTERNGLVIHRLKQLSDTQALRLAAVEG